MRREGKMAREWTLIIANDWRDVLRDGPNFRRERAVPRWVGVSPTWVQNGGRDARTP